MMVVRIVKISPDYGRVDLTSDPAGRGPTLDGWDPFTSLVVTVFGVRIIVNYIGREFL